MKKRMAALLAGMMILATGAAAADQQVTLPESSYSVTIPDGMIYDGPGTGPDTAVFAWIWDEKKLDIQFFSYDAMGNELQTLAEGLREAGTDASIYEINGIEMLVYRLTDPEDPPEKGMKCIGYILKDGEMIKEICFWYGSKEAAKLTETIISSIQ